jgi:hypothetical protein
LKRVTYVRKGETVLVNAFAVNLVFDGKPWVTDRAWSLSAEAFERLRIQNPNVKFVEENA